MEEPERVFTPLLPARLNRPSIPLPVITAIPAFPRFKRLVLFREVGDDGVDVVALQLPPPAEEGELDDEGEPIHRAAESFDQFHRGRGGSSGREEVIHD